MSLTKRFASLLASAVMILTVCFGGIRFPDLHAAAASVPVTQLLPEEENAVHQTEFAVDSEPFSLPDSAGIPEAAVNAEDTPIFTSDIYEVTVNCSRGEIATVTLTYGNIWPAVGNVFIRGYDSESNPVGWEFGKAAGCSREIEIYGRRNGGYSLHFELIQESTDIVLNDLYIYVRVTSDTLEFYSDADQITLNKSREETEIITLTYENLPDGVDTVYIQSQHGTNRLTSLDLSGEWSGNSFCVPVTGWKNGTEDLTFRLINYDNDNVLAEITVAVNVTGDTFAFYPSQNLVEIVREPNAGASVRLNYENLPEGVDSVYMRVKHGENPVTEVDWDEWIGHAADLYISPLCSGSERLTVFLINSETDLALAETYIDIRITGSELEFYATASELTIDRSRNATQTVYLVFENLPDGTGPVYIRASHGTVRKTDWEWGSWASNMHDITFRGIEDGTEAVTFTLIASETETPLASCTVTLNVISSQVQFYASADAVTINGANRETIFITFAGVPESVKRVTVRSLSDSYQSFGYEWGEWDGATVPAILTGHQNGTDYFSLVLLDSETEDVLASLRIPVTVTGSDAPELTGSGFVWGRDNWNFCNSSPDYFGDSRYRDQISEPYLSLLASNLTNTEYTVIFNGYYYGGEWQDAWLNEQFGGSCYGMSSLIHLGVNGFFDYSSWDPAAKCIHDFCYPVESMRLSSLITYYQMLQVKDATQNVIRTVKVQSHEQNIKSILSELNSHDTVLICFQQPDWGGHAILAVGKESGSFFRSETGVTYQGRIRICDPNSSARQSDDHDIYYRTDTYEWMIPCYYRGGISSAFGARINYIGTDVSLINNGGLFDAPAYSNAAAGSFARMDMAAVSESHYLAKVKRSSDGITSMAMGTDDIITDESFRLRGTGEGSAGYLLRDIEAAYKVHQNIAEPLRATMDYDPVTLSISADAASDAVFDPDGYTAFSGDASDFCFAMTFDADYPTDWFFIGVSGEQAEKASLEQVPEGYILTADRMQNIRVTAMNRTNEAEAAFSCDYGSVLIYEVNPQTIGIAADTNGDGVYETPIAHSDILMGDMNSDRRLSISDAVLMQKVLTEDDSFYDSSSNTVRYADMDGDGCITVLDMKQMLRLLT